MYTLIYCHPVSKESEVKARGLASVQDAITGILESRAYYTHSHIEDLPPVMLSDLEIDLVQNTIRLDNWIITPDIFAHYLLDPNRG